jgi:hypothetical protein
MKIRSSGAWVDASKVIKLGVDLSNNLVTLQDWYDTIAATVQTLQSELYFQSVIISSNITLIPIPGQFLSPTTLVIPGSRAFVTVNGLLINPLLTTLEPGTTPTAVKVPTPLNIGDKVSVVIKYIQNSRFHLTEQSV